MKVLFSTAALVLSLIAFAYTGPKATVSPDIKSVYTDTVPGDTIKKPKDTTKPKPMSVSVESIK